MKEMSLDGLERIARGGTGECYRVDEETVLKIYYEGIPQERALREKACARTAFALGVPTAISFDTVRVGERAGVLYELLQGLTLSQQMRREPDSVVQAGELFAEIAKTLHNVDGDAEKFGHSTDVIRREIPKIDYADVSTVANIYAFLDSLDGFKSYVHGDFHPNNVMVCDGEPRIIDLGGFSVGCPAFDIATLRFCLFDSPEASVGGVSTFTGLNTEQHRLFWQSFIRAYFHEDSLESAAEHSEVAALVKDVELLKMLRFERLYRNRYSNEQYFESIRREVCARWKTA